MKFPEPGPGLVFRYSYLWHAESTQGREDGTKDRPCAVVLSVRDVLGRENVVALPVTHSQPRDPLEAVEIPEGTKRRLGLDAQRSWIVLTESNRFIWPGPDLRPSRNGDLDSVAYGLLPRKFFLQVRERWLALAKARQSRMVGRTE